uniref:U8 snoRNA-decapping enzyme n=2 Tax=Salmo trutta TaxID=8032 RepID=A0A673XAX9_SALTR
MCVCVCVCVCTGGSMASGQLSREEALACVGCRHACHILLYADTEAQLFEEIPIRHIVLMQMRFDGLLGFPGGLVDPSEESLEEGLSRELWEELGFSLSVTVEDHVSSCHNPSSSSSHPITHFYARRMEEKEIREVEKAAASTATDHGHEVAFVCTVCLYGIPCILSPRYLLNPSSSLPGDGDGPSSSLHTKGRRRRAPLILVPLLYWELSLSAGGRSSALRPGDTRGATDSTQTRRAEEKTILGGAA